MPPSARGDVAVQPVGLSADFGRRGRPGRSVRGDRGGQRREHVTAMKGRADIAHPELHQPRVVDA